LSEAVTFDATFSSDMATFETLLLAALGDAVSDPAACQISASADGRYAVSIAIPDRADVTTIIDRLTTFCEQILPGDATVFANPTGC
jgi:hypothetical protein